MEQDKLRLLESAIVKASATPNNAYHAHSISREYGFVCGVIAQINGTADETLNELYRDYLEEII